MTYVDATQVAATLSRLSVERINTARQKALQALQTADLEQYYAPEGDFGGNLFRRIGDNPQDTIAADDLLALGALSIRMPKVQQIRRALFDENITAEIGEWLRKIPSDVDLQDSTDEQVAAVWNLNQACKEIFNDPSKARSDWWVASAKLAARKRPRLIPVRDSVVRSQLEMRGFNGLQQILVIREIARDDSIQNKLDQRIRSLHLLGLDPEVPLRVLDAAMWCTGKGHTSIKK